MSKIHTIFDVDGDVLYQGTSKPQLGRNRSSKKYFIEDLVKSGKSLSRANLAKQNLKHLDLSGADFSGANLDQADLTGSDASRANFREASLRGVRGSGFKAGRADFTDANFGPYEDGYHSIFNGSIFTYAKMDATCLDHVDFSNSFMSSATLVGATGNKASFEKCVMHNVDYADATLTRCNFKGAILRPTIRIAEAHFPDRTRGATIVGNNMKDTEIGTGNSKFKIDKWTNTAVKSVIWGSVTAGLFFSAAQVPDLNLDYLSATVSSFGGNKSIYIMAASAYVLFRTKIEDFIKDQASDLVTNLNIKVRQTLSTLAKGGKALSSMAVAFVNPTHWKKVRECMQHPQKTVYQQIKATVSGKMEIVICDRKDLGRALSRLSDVMVDRYRKDANLIIARHGFGEDLSPNMIAINTDGTTEAFWRNSAAGTGYKKWDKSGQEVVSTMGRHWDGWSSSRNELIDLFMKKVITDNDVHDLKFDSTNYGIREGRDGSVVVIRRSDGRVMNPSGAYIVTPDGMSISGISPSDGQEKDNEEDEKYGAYRA